MCVQHIFLGFPPLVQQETGARPLPAAGAITVTSQSYSVNPPVTAAHSSSAQSDPGHTQTLPMHGTSFNILFLFCCIVVLLFIVGCWLPALF